MNQTPVQALYEWHEKFGVTANRTPTLPSMEDRLLRMELIREEFEEFIEASANHDIEGIAKELADLLYVVYGAAITWGIPIDEVFAEVHRSNMTKLWPDGTVKRREDGKVLKPPTYSPADVKSILEAHENVGRANVQ